VPPLSEEKPTPVLYVPVVRLKECVLPFRRVAARIASIDSRVTLSTFSFYLVSFQLVEPEY
jgi:hypothetical protein